MLQTALRYEENNDDRVCDRFVFGTESCLPMYPLQQAGERLFSCDGSWLSARHQVILHG